MSLWKLRVGAEAYYLAQVASGLDDYYSGQGESVGGWVGNAANGLGLDGEVSGGGVWGTRRLPGAGFVAAQFRHRTSRAGDPQLHWHVLVANITQGPDRRWSALDGTGLYRSKRTAGVVFQAALRRELSERLG